MAPGQRSKVIWGRCLGSCAECTSLFVVKGRQVRWTVAFVSQKVFLELEAKLGVYGQALIKKHGWYWPKGVSGEEINKHFATKEIGASETWKTEFESKTMMI